MLNKIKKQRYTKHYLKQKPIWKVFHFKGNAARYAVCSCGYSYFCSQTDPKTFEIFINKLYKFCPNCGKEYSIKYYDDYTDILLESEYDSYKNVLKDYYLKNHIIERDNNENNN